MVASYIATPEITLDDFFTARSWHGRRLIIISVRTTAPATHSLPLDTSAAWDIPNQMNTNKTTDLPTLGRNLPPDVVDTPD